MNLFFSVCSLCVACVLSLMIFGSAYAVILGNAPVAGSDHDSSPGQVYIYNGAFGISGVPGTFTFFGIESGTDRWVTPLLFQKTSESDFILRGIGTPRNNPGGGVKSYDFTPMAGSSTVSPDYTFGFTDRKLDHSGGEITTLQENTGIIDLGYGGPWLYTPSQDFEIELENIFRTGITSGSEHIVMLHSDRTYSAQLEAQAMPEPPTFLLMTIGLLWIGSSRLIRKVKAYI